MRIELWTSRFSEDYGSLAPQTFDTDLPIRSLVVGTVAGAEWLGASDSAMQGMKNPVAFRRYASSMANVGIKVSAGIGVTGQQPVVEGMAAAAALKIAGRCIINFEPGFLTGPMSNIKAYMETLRAICPDEHIGVTLDPTNAEQVSHFLPYIDSIWQAAYFGHPPDCIDVADPTPTIVNLWSAAIQNAPTKTLGILLWAGDYKPERLVKSIQTARAVGAEVGLFRRIIWTPENIAAVRALAS